MPAIAFEIVGRLLVDDQGAAFLLQRGGRAYAMRLGFILRGSEEVILPDSLLDDWGHEIVSRALYSWVSENGLHFPRAEIFGFDPAGRRQQCFMREVDLPAGYASYVFETAAAPIDTGRRLSAIFIPGATGAEPKRISTPTSIAAPLSKAAVRWWSVDAAAVDDLEMHFLD